MSNLSQVTSAILPQGNVSDIIQLQGISSEEQVSFFIKIRKRMLSVSGFPLPYDNSIFE